MLGMRAARGVVMAPHMGEIIGTVAVLMNVHAVEIRGAGSGDIRKAKYLRLHQDTAVRGIIEFYQSADVRISGTAPDPGHRLRTVIPQLLYKGKPGGWLAVWLFMFHSNS